MTSAWTYLTQGNIMQSMLETFVGIGIEPVFLYMIFVVVATSLIYIRSRSTGLVGLTLALTGIMIFPYIDAQVAKYFYGIILVGISMVLYSALKSD